jgi:hypothetical protein
MKQAFLLCALLVVGQYFGIELFSFTDGPRLLKPALGKRVAAQRTRQPTPTETSMLGDYGTSG